MKWCCSCSRRPKTGTVPEEEEQAQELEPEPIIEGNINMDSKDKVEHSTPKGSNGTSKKENDTSKVNNKKTSLPPEVPVQDPSTVSTSITGWTPSPLTPDFDWDGLYDQPDDNQQQEVRPSVLGYLLSQLRIGMDLSKVTLPTYILERRSLLEMYADFFAHPDLFVAIADAESPEERMIAAVRWYLTCFHAGRKSEVAKKPYNPILGEVFSCWWSNAGGNPADKEQNMPQCSNKFDPALIRDENRSLFSPDGSFLPWCYDSDTLIYYGEQISHHPPVSAFYAEHPGKRIFLNGHIWTKSKFQGLSVAVHHVGEAIVTILQEGGKKEEYVLEFPSAYARSVLNVPWIELGGTVHITCAQTGYKSEIEFCTKTLMGRDRNRVIAKIFSPSDPKKPFMLIDGLWNEVMQLKVPDINKNYLDVRTLTIWKKQTRKVVEQEPFESRRMWKDVTKALKFNELDTATLAKKYLEEKQRRDAKTKDESKIVWRPRMFESAPGDKWVFIQSLDKRCGL